MSTAAVPYPRLISSRILRALRGSGFSAIQANHHGWRGFHGCRGSSFLIRVHPVHPWLHRLEHNRNDPAFDCFAPKPRGWKPRPPAFAEPTAGRPATVPSDIESAEPSSAVDEASCLVSAPSTPAVTRLISSRTFAPFAVQNPQPPEPTTTDGTDFADAADGISSSA
jgi:hypothetical protein